MRPLFIMAILLMTSLFAPAQPIVQENPPARSEELPQCTSVSCDGIDYSMLVSR